MTRFRSALLVLALALLAAPVAMAVPVDNVPTAVALVASNDLSPPTSQIFDVNYAYTNTHAILERCAITNPTATGAWPVSVERSTLLGATIHMNERSADGLEPDYHYRV